MSFIYLDACIIIYIVERHPTYSSRLEALLYKLEDSELCCSPLAELKI